MTTRLEKAKGFKKIQNRWNNATKEELEVALAWINEELDLHQVCIGLGLPTNKSSNGLYRVAVLLREAYRRGMLVRK